MLVLIRRSGGERVISLRELLRQSPQFGRSCVEFVVECEAVEEFETNTMNKVECFASRSFLFLSLLLEMAK